MNRKIYNGTIKALILLPFLAVSLDSGAAGLASVLDPAQHPESPQYDPVFNQSMLPLDAQLSWKNRFNGDETFNSGQVIGQNNTSTMTAAAITMTMKPESMQGMQMDGVGVIKALQIEQGKVKISHGPIDKYGMPAMTMMFKVSDPSMLEGLEKDQQIGFDVDNSSGGFVVTHIMAMPEMTETMDEPKQMKMDAQGVVQAVRIEQGKIKIKHGPIDKYGMPGMTMMFKVSDPALLTDLQKGANIDFNIDNASGGFVITNIVPVEQ